MNKKAQMTGMLYFVMALFVTLFVGFLVSMGIAVLDWGADEIVPEIQGFGDTPDVNFTKISAGSVNPINNVIQALPGIAGVLFILMMVASLGMAYMFRTTGDRWLLFVFIGLNITLILSSIAISIIYEDFYDDNGELGDRLKEQGLMSFLLLYSPAIFTVIAFVGAIIMFTGFEGVEV